VTDIKRISRQMLSTFLFNCFMFFRLINNTILLLLRTKWWPTSIVLKDKIMSLLQLITYKTHIVATLSHRSCV